MVGVDHITDYRLSIDTNRNFLLCHMVQFGFLERCGRYSSPTSDIHSDWNDFKLGGMKTNLSYTHETKI